MLKVAIVFVTLGIGAYNFRRVQPNLIHEEGAVQLRRSAAFELTAAALVVVLTGFLTGISP
jgi:putative copper export protein